MVYLLFSCVVLCLVTVAWHDAYCLTGIESVYLGLYKGVLEEAVVLAKRRPGDIKQPTFYLPRLRSVLSVYFNENLTPYCREYTFSARGVTSGTDYSTQVTITFYARISDVREKTKTAYFRIERSS